MIATQSLLPVSAKRGWQIAFLVSVLMLIVTAYLLVNSTVAAIRAAIGELKEA